MALSIRLFLLSVALVLGLPNTLFAQNFGDPVSRTQTQGQFVAFDAHDTTRFYMKTQDGFELRLVSLLPELQCFLANHTAQDLRFKYTTYETEDQSGSPQRTLVATEILSLKTGENLKDWPAKEAADSTLATHDHETLAKYLKYPSLVR